MRKYLILLCVFVLVCGTIAYARMNLTVTAGENAAAPGGGGGYETPTFRSISQSAGTLGPGDPITLTTYADALVVADGDLVVCVVGGTQSLVGITVGGESLVEIEEIVAGYYVSLWYKEDAAVNAAAAIVADFSESANYVGFICAAYSNIALSSALDEFSCNAAGCDALATAAATRTSQNVTTDAQTDELLIGVEVSWDYSHTYTAAGSYTLRSGATTFNNSLVDLVVTSTGTYPSGNFTTTDAQEDQYFSFFVTFNALVSP